VEHVEMLDTIQFFDKLENYYNNLE